MECDREAVTGHPQGQHSESQSPHMLMSRFSPASVLRLRAEECLPASGAQRWQPTWCADASLAALRRVS